MDNLFRAKFDNFEVDPPEHVWENIQVAINKGNGKGGATFNKGGIAGLSIILITLGLVSFYLLNNSFKIKDDESNLGEIIIDQEFSTSNLLAVSVQEVTVDNQLTHHQVNPSQAIILNNEDDSKKERKIKRKNRKASKSKNGAIFILPDLTSAPTEKRKASTSLVVVERINMSKPIVVNTESVQQVNIRQTYSSNQIIETQEENSTDIIPITEITRGSTNPSDAGNSGSKNDYRQDASWQVGLFFTPEMISYNSDNQLKNYSYSFDLQAIYRKKNLILQSGIGLAQVTDKGDNRIDYHKYLGSYQDVYDITFDTTGSGLDPIFHTDTVHVYDTLNSTKISPTKRKFTYLQIPLLVGYGKEFKRFGWFIKAGPSLSLLINEDTGQAAVAASEEDKIINVDNELPGRIQANWQFVISGGTTFKLGKNLSFSFEPMFRYYLQSAYEQNKLNTRHPYSIGLRSGLLLNF